jgi:magnesium transporter
MMKMMDLLPPDQAGRIGAIISDRESTAAALMTTDFITAARETKVSEILEQIRASRRTHDSVSHIYIVAGEERQLAGVVDLRDLVLAADAVALEDLMVSLVVTAQQGDMREDLAELFAKYHFRMLPIVDAKDHLLGVIHYRDIMRGLITRARA